jgi:hypothetical protein
MLQEFEFDLHRLREENAQLRYNKEMGERKLEISMHQNQNMMNKLGNLEVVFIG